MAESFLFGIAQTLLEKLASHAVKEIGDVVRVTKELNKLRNTLEIIRAVRLDADADQRLYHQTDNQLKVWLQRLKDVCLDAEDVLDDFEIAALQHQLIQRRRRNVLKKVSHFFSSSNPIIFRYRMSHKIKEIREELDAIAADRDKFQTTTPNQNRESNRIVPEWRDTHSSPSDIIGRGHEIEKLVNVLMQMDPNSNNNYVDVVTIVGIGGLGKTALAKSLYNDPRVQGYFKFKKWVCVGEIFEAKTIIGKIVNNKDLTNMEDAHKSLEETLSGKRYLLILDDVWNEEVEKWNALMELFLCGNKGSKIIVTTRSQSIANFTSTNYTHTLRGLLEKDSVPLLLEQALGKGQEDRFPDLVEIGKDIVKKCKGVPLAIRTLGALLYKKTDKKEWCWVRDDKLLNLVQKESGILPVLELSFIHLPSYLKPCFSFCSLFDKDTEYNTEDMIGTWMALGYLQSGKSKSQLEAEDIGLDYFKKLWSKSFFQDVEEDQSGHYRFKMHDLMHDLAISLGKGEYTNITPVGESVVVLDHGRKVRHLAFPSLIDDSVNRGVPEFIVKQKGLRSITTVGDLEERVNSYKLFITSISEFKYLRVLVFMFTGLEVIPSSIGGLKHLRLLRLRGNKIIKTLPDSVCKLVGLQTLDVSDCYGLERLPKDIGELVNLRSLHLTTQQQNFSHQTGGGGRGGIASLSYLRFLSLTWSHNLESLFDLSHLTHLRTLEIMSCNRLKSLPPTLRNLRRLETLSISNCEDLDMMRMMTDNEQLTENIGGPDGSGDGLTSLRYLSIRNIPKLVNIPNWLLQDLQHCVSLQHMRIESCTNMTSLLGGETGGTTPYRLPPTLQKLKINKCGRLDERCARDTGEDWQYISHVPNILINKQKVVIMVDTTDEKKSRVRAMKIAACISGVESLELKGDNKDRLEVIGNEIDIVQLAKSLRKTVVIGSIVVQ